MTKTADKIYWLHAVTSLHVGTGRGEGYIDLPLAREQVTRHPYIPGSSVKGVLADAHGATKAGRVDGDGDAPDVKRRKQLHRLAFGMTDDEEGENGRAGALVLTDARLVCLPIRSVYGTFAWCTSPWVLQRLRRDLDYVALAGLPPVPELSGDETCLVPQAPVSQLALRNKVYLEDLDLAFRACPVTKDWAARLAGWLFPAADETSWRDVFCSRFAVLPDNVFNFFCETGTEVQPHVRIEEDTKRVASGALWYEESLPSETILAGLVWCDRTAGDARNEILTTYCGAPRPLQIGGKATVGKGRVRCIFTA